MDRGDPALSDYQVQLRQESTPWTTIEDGFSTTPSLPLDNLQPGERYEFRVRGENGGGGAPWSDVATITMPAATAPDPTGAVTVSGVSTTSATIGWVRPAYDGGAAVLDVVVELSTDGGATWVPVPHAATTSTSLAVTGLVGGTTYLARVASLNSIGVGGWSPAASFTTDLVPATPPRQLTARLSGPRAGQLSWLAPSDLGGAPSVTYVVESSRDAGATWVPLDVEPFSARSLRVDGLARGTTYAFRVLARNGAGTSAPSNEASLLSPRTVASAPRGVRAKPSSITSTSATIQWLAPQDSGGALIVDYVVDVSVNNGRTWVRLKKPQSRTRAVRLTGLKAARTYQVRVRARNQVGLSDSARTSFTTDEQRRDRDPR